MVFFLAIQLVKIELGPKSDFDLYRTYFAQDMERLWENGVKHNINLIKLQLVTAFCLCKVVLDI